MLRQFGYASSLFPSAEAFANHSDFDRAVCVLLDINLGDGSGIELRHRLNAAGISVPVIAPLPFNLDASPISQSHSRRSR
jgi:FixJ family two-component response regulator